MIKLNIQAITESGSVVYTDLRVREDYTMSEVVKAVKAERYTAFRLATMKVFVTV